jgi:hypothetical protein
VHSIAIDVRSSGDRSMTRLPRILPLVQVDPCLGGDRTWAKGVPEPSWRRVR